MAGKRLVMINNMTGKVQDSYAGLTQPSSITSDEHGRNPITSSYLSGMHPAYLL